VPDRREAIRLAVRLARTDDTILIAGKGHETYQIIGRTTIPFDDREEVVRALADAAVHAGKEGA
jgi:UDP-N-acetylmuramoyl-L-alanyl-D-glutamate--2,6-diaminopimelate ligase